MQVVTDLQPFTVCFYVSCQLVKLEISMQYNHATSQNLQHGGMDYGSFSFVSVIC
jgi:hypothetical protein